MKGIFSLRPALPRYVNTWDVSLVLKYLKGQSPPDALTFLALSRKLVTLLILLTGQWRQSIHPLQIKDVECKKSRLILRFSKVLKTSAPTRQLPEIVLPAFDQTPGLCVVRTYEAYLTRSKRYRRSQGQLFIQTIKPFHPIKRDTLGKWVKATLELAGVNMGYLAPIPLGRQPPVLLVVKGCLWPPSWEQQGGKTHALSENSTICLFIGRQILLTKCWSQL